MTRKRWVMFSNRIGIEPEDIPGSDVEDECVLILAKDGKSDKQADEGTREGSDDRRRFRQQAVVHRQPEAIDHVDDGIQLEDPLVLRWYEVEGVDDGSYIEPGRQHDLQNMGHVPVINV